MMKGDPFESTWADFTPTPSTGQVPRGTRYAKRNRVNWIIRLLLLADKFPRLLVLALDRQLRAQFADSRQLLRQLGRQA